MNKNHIRGGSKGQHITIYCDGVNVYEIDGNIANDMGHDSMFTSFFLRDLLRSQEEQKVLCETFPDLSDDAYCTIRDANLREVFIEVFYKDYDEEMYLKEMYHKNIKIRHIFKKIDTKTFDNIAKLVFKSTGEKISKSDFESRYYED